MLLRLLDQVHKKFTLSLIVITLGSYSGLNTLTENQNTILAKANADLHPAIK